MVEIMGKTSNQESLLVALEGRKGTVDRAQYVRAKTGQLREFGYTDLTEDEVNEQIDALLAKKQLGAGLTVIGALMKDEIQIP